jgi:Metallo-peptidase family M12
MKQVRWMGTLTIVMSLLGCGGGERSKTLTYDEFKAQAYQEPDTGVFVHNGDEIAESEGHLREAYDRYARQQDTGELGTTSDSLIVNRVGGADDKYSASRAANINYCVSQSSFGSRYSAVVSALNSAASAWEGTATVNFVHSSGQDGNCSRQNKNVWFNVRQVCTGQYLARAFFPSSSRNSREILIDCTSFGNIAPWTLAGVLRHELGHTIGFRHEHTRPESGTCFEDNNWRALTSYDSASVMHYPQCNGTNNGDLSLTTKDKSGARLLYP